MNKDLLKREALLLAVLLAPIVFLITVWDRLPAELPIHWNLQGEADDYGPKYLTSLFTIGIYFLMLLLPKIDPRKKNYDIFSATYFKLRFIIILFMGALNSMIIANGIGFEMDMGRIIVIAVLLLLTAMGNYMSTLRSNWFIGIRLPWTMESDTVWRKTHQLAGKLWFWMGLAAVVICIFVPEPMMHYLAFSIVLFIVIIPIIYSYIIYRKEKKDAVRG